LLCITGLLAGIVDTWGLRIYDNVTLIAGYKCFGRKSGLLFSVEGRGKQTNQPTQHPKQSTKQPEDQPMAVLGGKAVSCPVLCFIIAA
jgi:hypothetical protein